MLDTLKTIPRFKAMYDVGAMLASGYYEINNFDYGQVADVSTQEHYSSRGLSQ